jgi:ATP-dependent exoDNAse (exonuclease V) alpha subunit
LKHYITALALSLSSTLCVAQTSSPSTTPAPAETAVATPAPVAAAPATTSAVVTALYTGKPRVLITGHDAYTEAVQANGSGVAVGRAVLGSASGTKTFSQHSEVWEVTRHFMDECKGAGRPFQQMQEAGMQTSRLDRIMRQKDPELLKAVQYLANNETVKGVAMLAEQGRITEVPNARDRIAAIARDYAANPDNTIIVSPDNRSRQQINEAVRAELRKGGLLAEGGQTLRTLMRRADMTGADRTWAARYDAGDVLQYNTGSKAEGIERGTFATVQSVNTRANTLTVSLESGSSVTYDPRRLKGVNVFREAEREFAPGDRVQFTAPYKDLGVANRDLGTVVCLEDGRMTLRMDGTAARVVTFNTVEFRQLDHGYAVTSHSSQGLTAVRVLAHIDTDSSPGLINNRLAYVSISRASEDARVYTNNAQTLGQRLASDVTKAVAVDFPQHGSYGTPKASSQNLEVRIGVSDLEPEGLSLGLR